VYETQTVCVSEAWDETAEVQHAVIEEYAFCTGCGWEYMVARIDAETGECFEKTGSVDDFITVSNEALQRRLNGESVDCLHPGNAGGYRDGGTRTVTTTVHHDAVYEDRQVQVGERCTVCGATR